MCENTHFRIFFNLQTQSTTQNQQSLLVNKPTSSGVQQQVSVVQKPPNTKSVPTIVRQQQIISKRNIVLNMKPVAGGSATGAQPTTQQVVTRIVKPQSMSVVQKIVPTSSSESSGPTHTSTPLKMSGPNNAAIVAKVLSAAAAGNKNQIVSLSDLNQKQPGTTSLISNRPGGAFTTTSAAAAIDQGNHIVQMPQYTVVTQNRPILTTGAQFKPTTIATQALNKAIVRTTTANSE